MNETILKALQWRMATKVFDPEKKVRENDFETILESARLAPCSYGIEAWKFIVVENRDVRKQLREVGYDQPKITDADRLVVIARRTDVREHIAQELVDRTAVIRGIDVTTLDGLKKMVQSDVEGKSDESVDAWIRAQAYIPLGLMIETAALLGIDSCPIEGFDSDGVDRILGFHEKHLHATTMIAFGYRGDDPYAKLEKVRRSKEEAIEWIK
jgi:nitroreductase